MWDTESCEWPGDGAMCDCDYATCILSYPFSDDSHYTITVSVPVCVCKQKRLILLNIQDLCWHVCHCVQSYIL